MGDKEENRMEGQQSRRLEELREILRERLGDAIDDEKYLPYTDENWFMWYYIIEDMDLEGIAELAGVSKATVSRVSNMYDLHTKKKEFYND